MKFSVQTLYQLIFKIWRKKRFELFLSKIQPKKSDVLLDVGGYPGFWLKHPQPVSRIDTLNLHLQDGWQPEKFGSSSKSVLTGRFWGRE